MKVGAVGASVIGDTVGVYEGKGTGVGAYRVAVLVNWSSKVCFHKVNNLTSVGTSSYPILS